VRGSSGKAEMAAVDGVERAAEKGYAHSDYATAKAGGVDGGTLHPFSAAT
jgi:hypothetical protein